jgi:hypothetical protein
VNRPSVLVIGRGDRRDVRAEIIGLVARHQAERSAVSAAHDRSATLVDAYVGFDVSWSTPGHDQIIGRLLLTGAESNGDAWLITRPPTAGL